MVRALNRMTKAGMPERAYCLKISQLGSFARNLIYSTKPTAASGYADPLADRRAGHAVAERVDPSDNVVAWNDRDVGMGQFPIHHMPDRCGTPGKTFTRIRRGRAFCSGNSVQTSGCRQHSGPLHASGPPLSYLPMDDAAIC